MIAEKLRKAILQAAIQGKLTEQKKEDGNARDLLKEIQAEREKQSKGKKYKEALSFSKIEEKEKPFGIPSNWVWCRFGEIVINRDADRIPVSKAERAKRDKIYDYYGASGIIDKIDDYLFNEDLLLIGEDGANLLNRSTPIAFIASGKYWVNNHAHVLQMYPNIDIHYLCYFINAINLSDYVTGTAQPKMNQQKMNSIVVPLPPLNEQKRIVNQIEKLLPRCDELAKTENSLQELERSFPQKLRDSLLQSAIQGKLTTRQPGDGNAADLLKQIEKEKEKLVKEKKIKSTGKLAPVTDEEKPFDIPQSWSWVRIGSILAVSSGENLTRNCLKNGGMYPVYGGNGIVGYFDKPLVSKDTLIIGRVGYYCGSVYLSNTDCWVTDNALIITLFTNMIDKKFLLYLLRFLDLKYYSVSTAQPVISGKRIYPVPIPIPPLAEQKRIVEKLESLLPLCDQLGDR